MPSTAGLRADLDLAGARRLLHKVQRHVVREERRDHTQTAKRVFWAVAVAVTAGFARFSDHSAIETGLSVTIGGAAGFGAFTATTMLLKLHGWLRGLQADRANWCILNYGEAAASDAAFQHAALTLVAVCVTECESRFAGEWWNAILVPSNPSSAARRVAELVIDSHRSIDDAGPLLELLERITALDPLASVAVTMYVNRAAVRRRRDRDPIPAVPNEWAALLAEEFDPAGTSLPRTLWRMLALVEKFAAAVPGDDAASIAVGLAPEWEGDLESLAAAAVQLAAAR